MTQDVISSAQLQAIENDLLQWAGQAAPPLESIAPVPHPDTPNQERLPLKPHDGIWQGPQGHQTAWYLEDPGPGPNGEVAVKGTPVGSDGSPLPFEGWYYADPTDDTTPTPTPTPVPGPAPMPAGGDDYDGADYSDIPGGYDGFQFGDPNDASIIDGNYLPPGGDFDIIQTGEEEAPTLTPFPIPARKTLGGTVGVQQSPRSLGRSSSNRSLNISAGYTGVPPGFTGVGPGFAGIPPGFTGIPSGYTGVNPLKVNNKVRRTGDLARGSGRFNRTLST